MNKQQYISFSFLIAALCILPQCDWFKRTPSGRGEAKECPIDTSEILVTIESQPIATMSDFESYMNEILEAQPQYKQIIQFMPDAEKQIFDGMVNELVLAEWVKKEGVADSLEYKKDKEKMEKYIDRSLAVKHFQSKHPVQVSKAEIRKFYDENKNTMPELMLAGAGVKAESVIFNSKDEAQKFYDQVKNVKVDFNKSAKDANLSVKNMGIVNEQSFDVEAPLREKLKAMKKFPAVEMVDIGEGKFAVVKATGKQDAQYVPFEQVESGLENFLKNQKSVEALTKAIDKLKKEYNVAINTEYFECKKKSRQEAAQAAMSAANAPAASEPTTQAAIPTNVQGA